MRDDLMPKIKINDNYSLHFNDIYISINIAAEWQILKLSLSHINLNRFFFPEKQMSTKYPNPCMMTICKRVNEIIR